MSGNWKGLGDKAIEGNPMPLVKKLVITGVVIVMLLAVIGFVMSFLLGGMGVIQDELNPRAIQDKYEWFKDCSAQLDAKIADIGIYESRMTNMKEMYGNLSRIDWARGDREQYNVWQSETAGLKASYNSLASQYNSQMAKWNWRFCNAGGLPEGATVVLPRDYKPYITE